MAKVQYRLVVEIIHYGEVDLDCLGYTQEEWDNLDYEEQQNAIDEYIDDEKSDIIYDSEKEYEITVY